MKYGRNDRPENGVSGVCFLFKPTNMEGETKYITVCGMNPGFIYSAEFYDRPLQNFTASGRHLMNGGFDYIIEGECGSEIIFLMVK